MNSWISDIEADLLRAGVSGVVLRHTRRGWTATAARPMVAVCGATIGEALLALIDRASSEWDPRVSMDGPEMMPTEDGNR